MPVVRIHPTPVVAILVSDIHLSLLPPPMRSKEKDWLAAMRRPWREVERLQAKHMAPVLCAGDVFDKWNPPSELVNWAIDTLPIMYGIPGNHDLPNHRETGAHRSGWGTLVRAGKIIPVGPGGLGVGELVVYGKPLHGKTPQRGRGNDLCLHVLLTHEFLWITGASYEGAPEDRRLERKAKRFREFDVVVVGDNHHGFTKELGSGTTVCNVGTPIRRRSVERHYKPSVGLLHRSGVVTRHYLSTKKDVLTEEDETPEETEEPEAGFVEELAELEPTSLDFKEHVQRAMRKTKARREVKDVVLEAME